MYLNSLVSLIIRQTIAFEFDEKKWTPISTQKSLTIAITSIGNFFRQAGLLKGVGI